MSELNPPVTLEARLRQDLDRPAPAGPKARLLARAAWRPSAAPSQPASLFPWGLLVGGLLALALLGLGLLFTGHPDRQIDQAPTAHQAPVPPDPVGPLLVAADPPPDLRSPTGDYFGGPPPEEAVNALSTRVLWQNQPECAMPFGDPPPDPFAPDPAG